MGEVQECQVPEVTDLDGDTAQVIAATTRKVQNYRLQVNCDDRQIVVQVENDQIKSTFTLVS